MDKRIELINKSIIQAYNQKDFKALEKFIPQLERAWEEKERYEKEIKELEEGMEWAKFENKPSEWSDRKGKQKEVVTGDIPQQINKILNEELVAYRPPEEIKQALVKKTNYRNQLEHSLAKEKEETNIFKDEKSKKVLGERTKQLYKQVTSTKDRQTKANLNVGRKELSPVGEEPQEIIEVNDEPLQQVPTPPVTPPTITPEPQQEEDGWGKEAPTSSLNWAQEVENNANQTVTQNPSFTQTTNITIPFSEVVKRNKQQPSYRSTSRADRFKLKRAPMPETLNLNHEPWFKFSGFRGINKGPEQYYCGCDSRELKFHYEEYQGRYAKKQEGYLFHCCKCKTPKKERGLYRGINEKYFQLCHPCHKDESYDITEERWYGKECPVCQTTIEDVGENIYQDIFVCSQECKVAYNAVHGANNFAHVPTKIKHYLERSKKNDRYYDDDDLASDYLDIEPLAKAYFKRVFPNKPCDEDEVAYNGQQSWSQANETFTRNLEDALMAEIEVYDESQIPNLEVQFRQRRPHIQNKLIMMQKDQEDPEGIFNNIKLCHECLLPYKIEELVQEGPRLLCKRTPDNNSPCCTESSTASGWEKE